METKAISKEIISPEGVEERVEFEETYRVTLTGGGKYRVYHIAEGNPQTVGIHDSKEAAMKSVGAGLLVMGGMLTNPERTLELVFESLGKREPK